MRTEARRALPIGGGALIGTALIGVLAVDPAPVRGQGWTIQDFEVLNVHHRNPPPTVAELHRQLARWVPALDVERYGLETVPITPETKGAIEDYLKEAAGLLAGWGFPEPALEPVVTTPDGRTAYRVFIVSGLERGGGEYHPEICDESRPYFLRRTREVPRETVILMDASGVLDGGRSTANGLQVAGHELFHAVQYATPFYGGRCDGGVGHWITEGTARAVGWDLYRILRDPHPRTDPENLWGLRNYAGRLPVARRARELIFTDPAYLTSSLWRYLAEYDASPIPPGPSPSAVDYRYLADLFRSPAVPRDCTVQGAECDAELRWLDDGLKSTLGAGLREALPWFFAAYALYGEHRAAPFDGSRAPLTGEEWGNVWRGGGLGACYVIGLSPAELRGTDTFSIEDLAARCWTIEPTGFPGGVTVEVEVGAPASAPLSQLSAALTGAGATTRVDTAVVVSRGGSARTTWLYDLPGGQESYFLLANAAHEAADTWPIAGRIPISFTVVGSFASLTMGAAYNPATEFDRTDFGLVDRPYVPEGTCGLSAQIGGDGPGDTSTLVIVGGTVPLPIRPGTYPIGLPWEIGGPGAFSLQVMPPCLAEFGNWTEEYGCGGAKLQSASSGSFTIESVSRQTLSASFEATMLQGGYPVRGSFFVTMGETSPMSRNATESCLVDLPTEPLVNTGPRPVGP